MTVLAVIAALGTGLMAGAFFVFSTFVLQSLARLPAPQGIAAMQSINRVILRSLFIPVFIGTGALCLLVGVLALIWWDAPSSIYFVIGAVLYLVGNLVVTGVYNVPRNNALDRLDPEAEASAAEWSRWVPSWLAGNHVRTITALAACALFILGAVDSNH